MAIDHDIWLTREQEERLRALIGSIGHHEVVRQCPAWSGGGAMDEVVPYLTRGEASSLIMLLSLVAPVC